MHKRRITFNLVSKLAKLKGYTIEREKDKTYSVFTTSGEESNVVHSFFKLENAYNYIASLKSTILG